MEGELEVIEVVGTEQTRQLARRCVVEHERRCVDEEGELVTLLGLGDLGDFGLDRRRTPLARRTLARPRTVSQRETRKFVARPEQVVEVGPDDDDDDDD